MGKLAELLQQVLLRDASHPLASKTSGKKIPLCSKKMNWKKKSI